jgi:hypothetical protein
VGEGGGGRVSWVSIKLNKNKDCLPLRITLPFANQITRADAKERALRLGRHGLREVALPRPWWPIEQDASPRRALAREQMGKLDGQDDGLLQRLLGHLEPRDVVPADVGLVDEDRTREACAQLFHLRILIAVITILSETVRARRHVVVLHNGWMEKLTSCPHHRDPHSPFHSLLSLVARAFRLLAINVP